MAETREVKTITKRKGIAHHQLKRVCAYIRVSTGHDAYLTDHMNAGVMAVMADFAVAKGFGVISYLEEQFCHFQIPLRNSIAY